MSLGEVIKSSFNHFKTTKEAITPEAYTQVFCTEAKKMGFSFAECERVERTIGKLETNAKKQAYDLRIKTIDELLTFLIALANRQPQSTRNDTISAQTTLIRLLLQLIEKFPNRALSNEAKQSLTRDLNYPMIVQDEKQKWQKILNETSFENIADQSLEKNTFDESDLISQTDKLNSIALELKEIVTDQHKSNSNLACELDNCDNKNDLFSIVEKLKNLFSSSSDKTAKNISDLGGLTDKLLDLKKELDQANREKTEDYITKTLNRRGLDQALREISSSYLAFLQIDRYEDLVVTLGRKSGETIQYTIITVAKNSLPNDAIIGRYGGNTFLMIFHQNAKETLENLVAKLPKKRFAYEDKNFSVTLSIGLVKQEANESIENALIRADEALKIAKESGGNRVVTK